jgi:anti-sigma factor RsiW
MNCRETRPLLPLFFDGELEARQMRAVALHSTRCADCETELRHFERLQEAVASHIAAMVDDVDLGQIWSGVAPRLEARAPSLASRLRTWWEERELGWSMRGPAFAAAAAIVLLTLAFWRGDGGQAEVASNRPAATRLVDNSALLDSVQSSVDSVALVTDEETNTTLLWIMDDTGATVEQAVDQWDLK